MSGMRYTFLVLFFFILTGCVSIQEKPVEKLHVLFDTDTNNELDDQHALAYLLFNGNTFDVRGITVNATRSGGDIEKQYAEAERVMRLCGYHDKLPLYKGANAAFDTIAATIGDDDFDGAEAVDFIIDQAKKSADKKLIVLAVGKLTNVALALKKDPSIASSIRVVWLGSNYPLPGEYNLENDTASLSFVLRTDVEFEMVTVRYGKATGSAFVSVTQEEVNQKLPGKGPEIIVPVTGRHGGEFKTFGDYSVNLFEHIDYHGTPPSRALFDMVAVAIVKNPAWGEKKEIPCPKYSKNQWVAQPDNKRTISIWENFDKENILKDFYTTLDVYQLVEFQ
jgi:purine nucleosidase